MIFHDFTSSERVFEVAGTFSSLPSYPSRDMAGRLATRWYVSLLYNLSTSLLLIREREHCHSPDSTVLHRCLDHLSIQHVRNAVDGPESSQSGPRTSVLKHCPLCSFCLRARSSRGDDQSRGARLDIHNLLGVVPAYCTNDTSRNEMGLWMAFGGTGGRGTTGQCGDRV